LSDLSPKIRQLDFYANFAADFSDVSNESCFLAELQYNGEIRHLEVPFGYFDHPIAKILDEQK
jgi:hypothetical protein